MLAPKYSDELYFSGNKIEQVQIQKDLGKIVSDDLKWIYHIKTATKKALGVFFMLKRSSPKLNPSTKLNLYKSMVLPILIYGSSCWFANVESCKLLENVQKRCLKWISYSNNSNYKELLQKNGILPLSLYMQLLDILLLSKVFEGYFDFDPTAFVTVRRPTRELRTSDQILFEHGKRNLHICEQSFFTRTTNLVNRLPQHIRFGEITGLKQRLLSYLWDHFQTEYNEIVSSTWRI